MENFAPKELCCAWWKFESGTIQRIRSSWCGTNENGLVMRVHLQYLRYPATFVGSICRLPVCNLREVCANGKSAPCDRSAFPIWIYPKCTLLYSTILGKERSTICEVVKCQNLRQSSSLANRNAWLPRIPGECVISGQWTRCAVEMCLGCGKKGSWSAQMWGIALLASWTREDCLCSVWYLLSRQGSCCGRSPNETL